MIRQCEKMLGDIVEGDALICDERRDPVLVRLAQVIAAESVGCFLETGTRYVTDCKGDVPLGARLLKSLWYKPGGK